MIKKFNKFTSFIIEDILSYDFAKERAKAYEKWVLIAEYCQINKEDYANIDEIYSIYFDTFYYSVLYLAFLFLLYFELFSLK